MARKYLFGLRGRNLEWGLIWAIIFPAYTLFGWNNGILGSLLDLPSWVATFPSIDTLSVTGAQKQRTAQIQGTVVALYPLGALFGSLSCILIGDPLGRRRTMGLGVLVMIVGVIIDTASFSLAQLIVGRIIVGFGFGALSATAPNWQSECSTAEHRGSAVLLESVFISLGLALQGWISFGVGFAHGSVTWRFPLSMSIFWGLLVLAALPFVPESPRWLVKKGRVEEARDVLAALENVEPNSPEVNEAIVSIENTLSITGQGRLRDVFTNGELRLFNRTCVASLAGFYQQFCGINALAFFQTTIFEQYLSLSSVDSRILAASVFTFQFISSPIGVPLVDRFGRRKLMITSALGMGISMAIIAGGGSQPNDVGATSAAAAFIFLFSPFFAIGFLGMSFLYASEISPLHVRTYITSFSTATVWLANGSVTLMTPAALANIKWRYFIFYAAFNLFGIVPTVYLFFPETSQRSLEEMDIIFRKSNNIFDPVKVSRNLPKEHHHPDSETSVTLDEKAVEGMKQ